MRSLKLLEKKMVKYKDLLPVKTFDNGEPLVAIPRLIIPNGYINPLTDMRRFTKSKILVRKAVLDKLIQVNSQLFRTYPQLKLFVSYGYRLPEIQVKYFQKELSRIANRCYFSNPNDLYEEVHRYIAVPAVAGHPTGGAVDVLVVDNTKKCFIDFGSKIYDFSKKTCYTFYPQISAQAKTNRLLLRSLMLKWGFAPFDGEWWHFSFGDREWAAYYKKNRTVYDQKSL